MRVTKSLFTIAAILALVSCNNELEQVVESTARLQLSADIAPTRAGINATYFDSGDAIGVFAYSGYSGMESWNVKATTDSKSWTLQKPVYLFPQSTTVYAYYPWDSYATDNQKCGFKVDATTQTNYMVGYDEDISYSNPKALITFRHITAKVSFYITYSDTKTGIKSVTLNGEKLPSSGVYTFEKGFGSLAANNMKIYSRNISTLTAGRQKAEFLLLPYASSCSATLNVTYADGAICSTTFTLPALAENCSYAYNVNISKVSMEISDAVIAPWDTPATMDEIVMGSTSLIGSENGHDYVDLGLSVMWATCNVGATKPEDYGSYFAWGETTSKTTRYDWSNLKYCLDDRGYKFSKYIKDDGSGTIDNKTILDRSDDAASTNWGGNWRMPTKAEQAELERCTWQWTSQGGKNGYMVIGKNGNFIFLPAAGEIGSSSSQQGRYWSSSLANNSRDAHYFCFSSNGVDWVKDRCDRYSGLSVRPVLQPENYVEVTDVSLSNTSLTLKVGESAALVATVSPSNATNRNVRWKSSRDYYPSIATVDENGVVTANSVGTATVTVYTDNGGKYAICTVTVASGATSGRENGYEWVDLGLSVKWATCNVGATKPEDYGGYYAWGETDGKDYCDWSTYKYSKGSSSTLTKYCYDSSYGYNGYTDTRTVLEADDDVAHVKWGGDWRMPTDAEWSELLNSSNCTWTWYGSGNTEFGGTTGYKVTSRKAGYEGMSIFLPAAGYRRNGSLGHVGPSGYYWSSSLYESDPSYAWRVSFGSAGYSGDGSYRYYGRSVRPVCP